MRYAALALILIVVASGCGGGAPVTSPRECGSFTIGDDNYLAADEPAAVGARCLLAAFQDTAFRVPARYSITGPWSPDSMITADFTVPRPGVVVVRQSCAGPCAGGQPPNVQECSVLFLDAGRQPVALPDSCRAAG